MRKKDEERAVAPWSYESQILQLPREGGSSRVMLEGEGQAFLLVGLFTLRHLLNSVTSCGEPPETVLNVLDLTVENGPNLGKAF